MRIFDQIHCLAFLFTYGFLLCLGSSCQNVQVKSKYTEPQQQEVLKVLDLPQLDLENYEFSSLSQLKVELESQLIQFEKGAQYLQAVIKLYDGEEEKAYQVKMNKLLHSQNLLNQFCRTIKFLTFIEWRNQRHLLNEHYFTVRNLMRRLYEQVYD